MSQMHRDNTVFLYVNETAMSSAVFEKTEQ